MPSKYILDKLSEEFDIEYLCRDGYTRILFNFDIFLNVLSKWMDDNRYSKKQASCILGISHSLLRFWYNGTVIRKKTYDKIETNLIKYNLIK